MLDRARERFPDRTFADLDAAQPQEGVADLDDAIDEILDDLSSRQASYDEQNSKLQQLLASDPTSAEVMQRWVETGDPLAAMVEVFGDSLGISEENAARYGEQLSAWRERKAANDAINEAAESNWQNSLSALKEWGDAKGLSLEQQRDVMVRLLSITFKGMENKYGPEDFDLALNAINHDSDVEAARNAGEVAGRNAKIATARRERGQAGAMPPSAGPAQGGRAREARPAKEKDIWDFLSK